MKEILKTIIVIMGVCNLTACSSLASKTQNISVKTNVPDALILVNNEEAGFGTVEKTVNRNKFVDIAIYKEGYMPVHKTVGKHNSAQGVVDTVVCGLGLIILTFPWCISSFAAPGAWSLDETDINLVLRPEKRSLQ